MEAKSKERVTKLFAALEKWIRESLIHAFVSPDSVVCELFCGASTQVSVYNTVRPSVYISLDDNTYIKEHIPSKKKWTEYPNNTVSLASSVSSSSRSFIHVEFGTVSSKHFNILNFLRKLGKAHVDTVFTYRLDQYCGSAERLASICRSVSAALSPGGYWLCMGVDAEAMTNTLLDSPESSYRDEDVSVTTGDTNARFLRVLHGLTGPDRQSQLRAWVHTASSIPCRLSTKHEQGWLAEPQVRYCIRSDALLEHFSAAGLRLVRACSLGEYVQQERFARRSTFTALGLPEGPLPSALAELLSRFMLYVVQKPAVIAGTHPAVDGTQPAGS